MPLEFFVQQIASQRQRAFLFFLINPVSNLGNRPCCDDIFEPVLARMLSGLRHDLDQIAVLQFIPQGNYFPVDLGPDARIADIGVNTVGKIDGRRPFGKGDNVSFRGEYINLLRKQRQLEIGHELPRIFDLLLHFQHFAQFLYLGVFIVFKCPPFLVFPVRGDALFRPLMHRPCPNLNFEPLSVGTDHRCMQ